MLDGGEINGSDIKESAGARFVLESLLDTIPQLYEARSGPVIKSFHFGGAEATRCSLRELGLPLLQHVERSLRLLEISSKTGDTSLPSVMQYEQVQQKCAFLWLESQTGISTWNNIIDYFLRTQKRTIENWAIAKSFIIDPLFPFLPNNELSKKINFHDPNNQRLIDWLATSPLTFFRVTPDLDFIGYEAIAHPPVEDFSPDYIPDFLWPKASQVTGATQRLRSILVDSNQRGDLLVSDRHSIIAARIKSRWTVYDHHTLETGDGSGARTLAARSAARQGAIAFSVSADGEISSYFQTKKYTADRVHQVRL